MSSFCICICAIADASEPNTGIIVAPCPASHMPGAAALPKAEEEKNNRTAGIIPANDERDLLTHVLIRLRCLFMAMYFNSGSRPLAVQVDPAGSKTQCQHK